MVFFVEFDAFMEFDFRSWLWFDSVDDASDKVFHASGFVPGSKVVVEVAVEFFFFHEYDRSGLV